MTRHIRSFAGLLRGSAALIVQTAEGESPGSRRTSSSLAELGRLAEPTHRRVHHLSPVKGIFGSPGYGTIKRGQARHERAILFAPRKWG